MPFMSDVEARSCSCHSSDFDCIEETIERNIGRIVIVFTESGGASGSGFTGLLAGCDRDCIKLVTTLPAPPPHPFPGCRCGSGANICGINDGDDDGFGFDGFRGFNRFGRSRRRCGCGHRRSSFSGCCNPFGSVIRIPICRIVSIVSAEP
ncbi:MAG: hypothetical protein N2Z65_05190 [Clostridiales bacterium]|nr:hypothetical protein [Clostridiales bacterium]